MRLSVIVPVLNEAEVIGTCLEALSAVPGLHELIIVDSNSTDATASIVLGKRPGAPQMLVQAPRGRAHQMNAGAAAATGDALLFLHADCLLPASAAQYVATTLPRRGVAAGAFRTRTVVDLSTTERPLWLRLADMRSRYTSLPYGDQGLFMTRDVFRRVGGFPDLPLMEDLEMSRRLRRMGRIERMPAEITVSGRRFLRHPLRTALCMNLFPALYRCGVSPRVLERVYGNVR
jgi:rSAM/selenodomain-associated transferase 2